MMGSAKERLKSALWEAEKQIADLRIENKSLAVLYENTKSHLLDAEKQIAELEKCLIGQQQSTETAHKKIECLKSRIAELEDELSKLHHASLQIEELVHQVAELEVLKTPSLPKITDDILQEYKHPAGFIDWSDSDGKPFWTQDAVDFLALCSQQTKD